MIYGYDNRALIGGFSALLKYDLNNCYNTGEITISNNKEMNFILGGLVAEYYIPSYSSRTILIDNCYAVGSISGERLNIIGGILGAADDETKCITINNCYSGFENINLVGKQTEYMTITNSGIKTAEQMKKEEFVETLNNGNEEAIWKYDKLNTNKGFPILYFQ